MGDHRLHCTPEKGNTKRIGDNGRPSFTLHSRKRQHQAQWGWWEIIVYIALQKRATPSAVGIMGDHRLHCTPEKGNTKRSGDNGRSSFTLHSRKGQHQAQWGWWETIVYTALQKKATPSAVGIMGDHRLHCTPEKGNTKRSGDNGRPSFTLHSRKGQHQA